MGGYGSGRDQWKGSTDDYVRLDVRWLQRQGYLWPKYSGSVRWSRRGETIGNINFQTTSAHLILRYRTRRNGGEWESMEYPVTVEWMPCRFGGLRAWLRCPAKGCGRRVAILYGARVFAYRYCLNLAYRSQKEAPHYRALHKAQAIHEKLGGTGIVGDPLFKPKGMHWRTFNRYVQRMEQAGARAVPQWLLRSFLQ